MAITVSFIAQLKRAAGTEKTEISSCFNTFDKVMDELLRVHPGLKNVLFGKDGSLNFGFVILLNGKTLGWPVDPDKEIKDGDELTFMVFFAGG